MSQAYILAENANIFFILISCLGPYCFFMQYMCKLMFHCINSKVLSLKKNYGHILRCPEHTHFDLTHDSAKEQVWHVTRYVEAKHMQSNIIENCG